MKNTLIYTLILIFTLVLPPTFAADQALTIDTSSVSISASSSTFLTNPRFQLNLLTTPGYIISFQPGDWIRLSHNYGSTWINQYFPQIGGAGDVYRSDHSHLHFRGDTVYHVGRASTTVAALSYYDNAGTITELVSSLTFASDNGDVRAGAMLPFRDYSGNGDTIVGMLHNDFGGLATYPFIGKSVFSTDGGATWGSQVTITSALPATVAMRAGLLYDYQSAIYIIDTNATGNINAFRFNRATQTWTTMDDGSIPILEAGSRGFAGTVSIVGTDTTLFLACGSNPVSGSLDIKYAFRTFSTNTWTRGTINVGTSWTGMGGTHTFMNISLCAIESSGRVVLTYQKFKNTTDVTSDIFCRVFNPTDSTWGNETLIIADGTWFSGYQYTPTAWGDEYYIQANVSGPARLTRIQFTESATPLKGRARRSRIIND